MSCGFIRKIVEGKRNPSYSEAVWILWISVVSFKLLEIWDGPKIVINFLLTYFVNFRNINLPK